MADRSARVAVPFVRSVLDDDPRVAIAIVGLLTVLNGVVLSNALRHHPGVGYDARHHLAYAAVLATGRLPEPADTLEYFSPPLAYAVPALAIALGAKPAEAARSGLVVQAGLSCILGLALLRLCERIRPRDGALKIAALLLCYTPAVYARTFAQLRGEPWLAVLTVLLANATLDALAAERFAARRALRLGLLGGLLLLARQWGALVLAGGAAFALVHLLRRAPAARRALVASGAVAAAIAFVVAGWFYVDLRGRFGRLTAFNLTPRRPALARQPLDFYFGTGNGLVFRDPVRPAFPNQLAPIFYADYWGDYWAYFLFRGREPATGRCLHGSVLEAKLLRAPRETYVSNHDEMAAYLGRVNAVSILPTLVLIAGLAVGAGALVRAVVERAPEPRTIGLGLVGALLFGSLAGYGWFLLAFPKPGEGDTIKAAYMLQVVPLAAVLGGEVLARLRGRSRLACLALLALLVAIAVHDAGTWVTRWPSPLDCLL